MDKKTYRLCETVADIAFIAGHDKFYSGDSRKNISLFIEWAQEFEEKHKNTEWGVNSDLDYGETVIAFADEKIKNYKP